MTALSAFFGPLALPSAVDHYVLATRVIPWASRVGRSSTHMLNIHYETMLRTPLEDVRAAHGIIPWNDGVGI